ncbi:energy-coupling factor transporter transmembrane component T family protein [Pectinatus haikarae]|uniref:Energy-coupling factor transport system permease protein n=1 Tax=Pectinatus haikarae TaxID=349096 RepID=A0ABT9Y519_9FIRM|nr:energy-coupling factor transporter transmembrane component T [Pectinatus haikarae]MDQ0202922.1 energy-coupling factor transport system permease protein [Pectinatus haikarae]
MAKTISVIDFAALTKLLMALTVSVASLCTASLYALGILIFLELFCAALMGGGKVLWKGIGALTVFAVVLALIQLLFGTSLFLAVGSAYKMFIMAVSLLILVATTPTQSITASLVKQCRLPYDYAFMITAVLRFVPDLLKESKEVRQAQACRGFHSAGNPVRRIVDYMMILKPMVFKAISRSENMAISLSLRGFSDKKKRTFMASTKLNAGDYAAMLANLLICIAAVKFA